MKLDCPACYGTGSSGETGGPCPDCEGRGYTCWMRVSCPPYKKAEFVYRDYGTETDEDGTIPNGDADKAIASWQQEVKV